jgi:hypothetical protein
MLIASRELKYAPEDGTEISVPIQLFAPEGEEKHWSCRFTIGWPNGVYSGAGHGVDQVQALYLALQTVGMRLYFSDYHKTGRLYFEKPGTGYGFPVPRNARDLLVGDDKRFEG